VGEALTREPGDLAARLRAAAEATEGTYIGGLLATVADEVCCLPSGMTEAIRRALLDDVAR
jgi:hypothetical protein